jgi:HK97 family phage major capsid protein
MKLTLQEFEGQLALSKSMPAGEARDAYLANLKSATVVEVAADGKETPVSVKLFDTQSQAKADAAKATDVSQETVDALVEKAIAKRTQTATPPAPVVEKAVKVPAEAKRFGTIKNFANRKLHGMEQDERAYGFGMWSMATMGNAKALDWCREHGIVVTKLQSEGTNTAGGYLVPEQFSADLIELKETYGVARRLFRSEPMVSDTKLIPRRVGGLTAYFVGEGDAGTESTTGWDQVRLTAKDVMVLTRMTNQVNADAIINWSDRLAYECSYANTLKEDQCAFLGTGTPTYGGISGVNTRLAAVWSTGTAGVGYGLVKQGTSTTWAAIVIGDFDNVVGSLPQYADTPNTCWVMHRSFYYSVVEKLIQAQGGVPAYETRQGQRAPRPIFKGYPVEFSQVMPSTTASAQVSALLGDFQLGAAFGDRQQDQIDFSSQASVGGQSMWERNEMGVRCIERIDINIHDVGTGTAGETGPIVGLITG